MPYISADTVKEKRSLLKKALPGFKLSVRTVHNSTVSVAVMSGPLEWTDGHNQINHFYIDDHYKDRPEWRDVFNKINDICKNGMKEGYESTDYGYVPGHYVDISVGRWNKPYQQK